MIENFFEEAVCPVCNNTDSKELYQVEYASKNALKKLNAPEPYPKVYIHECNNCQHHYSSPQLTNDALNYYYGELNSEYYTANRFAKDHLKNEHQDIVKYVEELIPNKGKLLEIGSGAGFLLKYFSDNGWDVTGVEPSPLSADFAKNENGLNIINGFMNENTFSAETFDVILLFDVVEHLKDAQSLFKLINRNLKKGGFVFFGTGNINSLNAKFGGRWWAYFSSWEHVSFFSPQSSKYLLNETGFRIKSIKKVSYFNSIRVKLHTFFLWNPAAKIFNFIKFILGKNFPIKRNIYHGYAYDHMIVIGKKIL